MVSKSEKFGGDLDFWGDFGGNFGGDMDFLGQLWQKFLDNLKKVKKKNNFRKCTARKKTSSFAKRCVFWVYVWFT